MYVFEGGIRSASLSVCMYVYLAYLTKVIMHPSIHAVGGRAGMENKEFLDDASSSYGWDPSISRL